MTDAFPMAETEVLIIGTGPSGAAAASLLSTYGIDNIVVNKYRWTAHTPRAHITNQRTMEVLRDLGVEPEAQSLAAPQAQMGENTYCTSLVGEELGRLKSWGTHPRRQGDYDLASPTHMCDLPQDLLEPLLVKTAAVRGSQVRFYTEYLSHVQDEEGVTTTLKDRLTGHTYQVRSKYLIGADGANSKVAEDIGLPLEGEMGKSGSMNLLFQADLSRFVAHRPSVLYWVIQPGSDVGGLGIGVVRMVRPWNRWLAIWGYDLEQGPPELTTEEATAIVHKLIGDDSIPVTIESTSTWTVNECWASENTRGRVFCMGDATHRHPPTNGLGSNTSIQDAYNLCWKLALVLKEQAAPSLLESYDAERSPVAEQIVKRANKSLDDFPPILKALGLSDTLNAEQMRRNMAARKEATPEAAQQRAALQAAIANTDYIYNAHGVEMNMRYESCAVVPDGTPDPGFERDKELYQQNSSRPGSHIPHVWLSRNGSQVSTLDLCGSGKFTLITGIGGEAWVEAAKAAEKEFGIELPVHIIGPGQTYEDPYGDFARVRETQETGALLVRPDSIVGWRADAVSDSATADLTHAVASILGRG